MNLGLFFKAYVILDCRRCRRFCQPLSVWLGLIILLVFPRGAEGATYQIRSQTAARATQFLRSDHRLSAPRNFSQALTLSAYDIGEDGQGRFNARISLRYDTDFALAQRLRQDPLFSDQWNDLTLDIAFLQWRPHENFELVAGRQWQFSPLGMADFDGISLLYQSTRGRLRPFASVGLGRDIQRGLTPFDPGAWDIQGLPPNETALTDDLRHFMGSASAGLVEPGRHRVELMAREYRRPQVDDRSKTAVTRRLGAAMTITPLPSLSVTGLTSFHSAANGIDRAHLNAALKLGPAQASAGIDHRAPIFDTHSIFNLFGAQPYRSAYLSYRHRLARFASSLELRAWTRAFFDEPGRLFRTGDTRALGASIGADHRLSLVVPLQIFWQISGQTNRQEGSGEQYLAHLHLRAPTAVDGLFLTGRFLGLLARRSHHRLDSGYGATAALGAELVLGELGRLTATVESRGASFAPANTALFALFEVEAWR